MGQRRRIGCDDEVLSSGPHPRKIALVGLIRRAVVVASIGREFSPHGFQSKRDVQKRPLSPALTRVPNTSLITTRDWSLPVYQYGHLLKTFRASR